MKAPDHTESNKIISKFVKPMTLGQALDDLFNHMYVNDMDEAMTTILDVLNVVYDKDTEQWVTADEGHPV